MLQTRARKALFSFAVVGAAALGAAGPAQAAIVNGSWDPLFGSTFAGLGWEGTAQWFVPDACLPQAGTVTILNSAGCSGGAMTMLGATVNFYDYAADPTGTTSFKAALTFGPQSIVNSVTVSGFNVSNVSTNVSSAGSLSGDTSYDNIGAFNWGLKFTGGQARLYFAKIVQGDDDEDFGGYSAYASDGYDDDEEEACKLGQIEAPNCGVNDYGSYPATVTFTTVVPEPQTYALMLAGLGIVGFMARRRRRA